MYVPIVSHTKIPFLREDCWCKHQLSRDLIIVDQKGRQHSVTIDYCKCEELAVTLLRLDLWPSSPPKLRSTFSSWNFPARMPCICQKLLSGICRSGRLFIQVYTDKKNISRDYSSETA